MHNIHIDNAAADPTVPAAMLLETWINQALTLHKTPASLTVRVVDEAEIQALNRQFRQKDKPTNVLSFPYEGFEVEEDSDYLGDIAVCATVVAAEAKAQHKSLEAHWAHMLIHSTLHLLGHDHVLDDDAAVMEHLEIELLAKLGYPNPYLTLED